MNSLKVGGVALLSAAAVWTSAAAAGSASVPDLRAGQAIYGQTCVACHGGDGRGDVPGAPDLTAAGGPLAKSDRELIRNVTLGFESPGSLMAMPPKGGNPGLTEADIRNVIHYLRREFYGAGPTATTDGQPAPGG